MWGFYSIYAYLSDCVPGTFNAISEIITKWEKLLVKTRSMVRLFVLFNMININNDSIDNTKGKDILKMLLMTVEHGSS